MSLFALKIQVGGSEHEVHAEHRGRAIAVITESGTVIAHGIGEATRTAAQGLGPHAERADRQGLPWGLYVEVGRNQAVYGDWPLLPGPPDNVKRKPSVLSRVRSLWHDGDGAREALRNAVKIIDEFGGGHRAAA